MELEIKPDVSILNKTDHDQGGSIDLEGLKICAVGSAEDVLKPSNEANSSGSVHSDMSYNDDDDEIDDDEDDGMVDYDDEEEDDYYMFENSKDDEEAHYSSMQAQFDKFDLPPGVEASFSWLKDPTPSASTKVLEKSHPADTRNQESSSSSNVGVENEDEDEDKGKDFKLFDTVSDSSDHYYNNSGFHGQQPPRTWSKKIQDEWKILEKDLPDTIFVRVYETRMDLLRAVIVGPAGTPYHDGLFVFDVHFPPTYPNTPPLVHYHSGGLRLNPNLYENGKVCLSLLNTWTGHGTEKWMPNNSTMLQVLVSIQALILNDKPFFNEPGYDSTYRGEVGHKKSISYNEEIFILSLKTMIYTLRRPPKYFERLVVSHFRSHAHVILSACRAYMDGAQVGSMVLMVDSVPAPVVDSVPAPVEKIGSNTFKAAVARMINGMVSSFSRTGASNCEQYRVEADDKS